MRLAAVSMILLLAGCGGESVSPAPLPSSTPTPALEIRSTAPRATLAAKPPCTTATEPFVPTAIDITGVDYAVQALPRDERNIPGVPSLGDKFVVAWDAPGVRPGESRGNVLLNTHTWPDGSALGNRFLARLHEGDVFVLKEGGIRQCYRVAERTEVSVENPPLKRVYDREGPPHAVIIVCSGTRLGPGEWTHRMLWFAQPVT